MTKTFLAFATVFIMSAGLVSALDLPRYGQTTCTGQQAGARKGQKIGRQDGSGPIHTPGTGGGTGTGRRAGRR